MRIHNAFTTDILKDIEEACDKGSIERWFLPNLIHDDESLLAKVASLSPTDRLEFIGVIWDTLVAEDLPVTEAEKALLDIRLADMERNPSDQSPWSEVKARLERLNR